MSSSEDVKNLFRCFGGEPDTYQEVVRERQTLQSLNKWTMLGQVELNHLQTIPSAKRAVKGSAVRSLLEETSSQVADALAIEPVIAPLATAPVGIFTPSIVAVQQDSKPAATRPSMPRAAWVAAPRALPQTQHFKHQVATAAPIPASVSVSVSEPAPHISPLAARLKTPIESTAIDAVEATNSRHSLVGLFGRLSNPQLLNSQAGVLRRKFIK